MVSSTVCVVCSRVHTCRNSYKLEVYFTCQLLAMGNMHGGFFNSYALNPTMSALSMYVCMYLCNMLIQSNLINTKLLSIKHLLSQSFCQVSAFTANVHTPYAVLFTQNTIDMKF